ncbi:MAG: hypothetical protein U1D30_15140 [Planctomycetota bacterium]
MVEIRKDLGKSVLDREVLIVEDIIDTGLTLEFLQATYRGGTAEVDSGLLPPGQAVTAASTDGT